MTFYTYVKEKKRHVSLEDDPLKTINAELSTPFADRGDLKTARTEKDQL